MSLMRGLGILQMVICAGCATAQISKTKGPAKIEVQGHRGARARLPENTLPAFDYALKIGVDTLELDTGVTKDNVVVIAHDPFLNPEICLGPGGQRLITRIFIRDLSFAELQRFDCGSLKNPRFPNQVPIPGTKVPSLAQLFDLVKNSAHPAAKTVSFNIETKIERNPRETADPETFTRLVVEQIQAAGFEARSTLQSFDFRTIEQARLLAPGLRRVLLMGLPMNYREEIDRYEAYALSPRNILLSARMMSYLRRFRPEVKVIPWTLNDVEAWDEAIHYGVDGIISDDPEALINHLRARGLR